MVVKKDFGFTFWIHLILIVFVWISPLIFNWEIILILILIYYFQLFVFGNCILTKKQFGEAKREETFYSYYLEKMGIRVDKKKLVIFLDYILPFLLLGVSYLVHR